MMKQTFYFMLCMAPLTVNAEIINLNPGNDISYQVNGLTATDNTYVFESGRGISVTDGGITIEKDFLVGTDFRAWTAPRAMFMSKPPLGFRILATIINHSTFNQILT